MQDLSINRLYPTLSPTHELWPPILYQRRVHSSHQQTSISFPLSKASFIVAGDGIYMRRDQDNAPYHNLLIVRGLATSPLVEIVDRIISFYLATQRVKSRLRESLNGSLWVRDETMMWARRTHLLTRRLSPSIHSMSRRCQFRQQRPNPD